MGMFFKKHPVVRWGLVVFALVLAGLCGAYWYLSVNYRRILAHKLPALVLKATDSTYHLDFSGIDIHLFTGKAAVRGVLLSADTSEASLKKMAAMGQSQVFDISIPELLVSGINWKQLLEGKGLDLTEVRVRSPRLNVSPIRITPTVIPRSGEKPFAVSVTRIVLMDPEVHYRFSTGLMTLTGGSISALNWSINKKSTRDSAAFYADGLLADVDSLSYRSDDGLTGISCKAIHLLKRDSTVTIRNLIIKPPLARAAYGHSVGHQQSMITQRVPDMTITGLDMDKALAGEAFIAKQISMHDPFFNLYYNRSLPEDRAQPYPPFPVTGLKEVGLPCYVGALAVNGGYFSYDELSDVTDQVGSFYINHVRALFRNMTNIPDSIAHNKSLTAGLWGNYMGRSDLGGIFTFDLADPSDAFTLVGHHNHFDASMVGDLSKKLSIVEVTSGNVSHMDYSVRGNRKGATAWVKVYYTGLSASVHTSLEDKATVHKRVLPTLLLNTFFVYRDNPMPGKEVRTATFTQAREKGSNFFNVAWKSIYKAAIKSAVRNEKVVNNLAGSSSKKDSKKKPGFFKRLFGPKNKNPKQ